MPTYTLQIDLEGDLLDLLDTLRRTETATWSRETYVRNLIKQEWERSRAAGVAVTDQSRPITLGTSVQTYSFGPGESFNITSTITVTEN